MAEGEEEIRVVVDTNVIISALLKDDSLTGKLIKFGCLKIFYPEHGLKEIEAYKSYILSNRSRASARQSFEYAIKFLLESMIVVHEELYIPRMKEAYELLKAIDEKDISFLALALQLECPLWTNDKHFRVQESARVLRTEDVCRLVEERVEGILKQ